MNELPFISRRLSPGVYEISQGEKKRFVFFYEPSIVRISEALEPQNGFSPLTGPLVPREVAFIPEKDGVLFHWDSYELSFGANLRLSLRGKHGVLLEETPFPQNERGSYTLNGEDYVGLVSFRLLPDQHFYGVGDHTGPLDKRNYQLINWNTDYPNAQVETIKSLYKSFPFYLSKKGEDYYGLFLDNPCKTLFDFGVDCTHHFFAYASGQLDFYLFLDEKPLPIIQEWTALTGRTPLPPRWSLGYQQSRWSYGSEAEVRQLAKAFKDHAIPLSAIHLDIDYMDGFRIFTWNKEKFPDPRRLSADLAKEGIHLVTIVDPGIKEDPAYPLYQEAIRLGCVATEKGQPFVGTVWPKESVFPSFNEERTREWWGERLASFVKENGISGIWCDMNEPTSFLGPLPADVQFGGVSHPLVHNVYGHWMAKATYDALKSSTKKRPFVITRAAYIGTARFSSAWTGDNQSIWDHLRLAIPQQLSLALSGLSFVGTDIGGFCGDTTPELLARWYELGLFSPLMRNHCPFYNRSQEPWTFDEKTLAIAKRYILLRYALLPYLYDAFYQEKEEGSPILRPVFLEDSAPIFVNENGEFLWGDSFLAAPVVEAGAQEKIVHFPSGRWFDFFSGAKYEAGTSLVQAPLEALPLFVKEGAIIPLYPSGYTNLDQDCSELILRVFPGQGVYRHYQDAGEGFAEEKGAYNVYEFSHEDEQVKVRLLHQGYPLYKKITVMYGEKSYPLEVRKNGKQ
jgi:alpha-glucosidase